MHELFTSSLDALSSSHRCPHIMAGRGTIGGHKSLPATKAPARKRAPVVAPARSAISDILDDLENTLHGKNDDAESSAKSSPVAGAASKTVSPASRKGNNEDANNTGKIGTIGGVVEERIVVPDTMVFSSLDGEHSVEVRRNAHGVLVCPICRNNAETTGKGKKNIPTFEIVLELRAHLQGHWGEGEHSLMCQNCGEGPYETARSARKCLCLGKHPFAIPPGKRHEVKEMVWGVIFRRVEPSLCVRMSMTCKGLRRVLHEQGGPLMTSLLSLVQRQYNELLVAQRRIRALQNEKAEGFHSHHARGGQQQAALAHNDIGARIARPGSVSSSRSASPLPSPRQLRLMGAAAAAGKAYSPNGNADDDDDDDDDDIKRTAVRGGVIGSTTSYAALSGHGDNDGGTGTGDDGIDGGGRSGAEWDQTQAEADDLLRQVRSTVSGAGAVWGNDKDNIDETKYPYGSPLSQHNSANAQSMQLRHDWRSPSPPSSAATSPSPTKYLGGGGGGGGGGGDAIVGSGARAVMGLSAHNNAVTTSKRHGEAGNDAAATSPTSHQNAKVAAIDKRISALQATVMSLLEGTDDGDGMDMDLNAIEIANAEVQALLTEREKLLDKASAAVATKPAGRGVGRGGRGHGPGHGAMSKAAPLGRGRGISHGDGSGLGAGQLFPWMDPSTGKPHHDEGADPLMKGLSTTLPNHGKQGNTHTGLSGDFGSRALPSKKKKQPLGRYF